MIFKKLFMSFEKWFIIFQKNLHYFYIFHKFW
jgi:hypothetical protein